ncbi:MAG: hypothetical protein ACLFWM_05835 [Actinomycetota bacterium]
MAEGMEDLARQLRQSAGHELRAEAAEDEELTERQRLRRRTLSGAAQAAMHRGDRVAVSVAGLSLSHPLLSVGEDYLTLEGDERWIDVPLAAGVITFHPRPAGGRSGRPEAATFRARVAELEQEQADAELVTRDGARWSGRIEILGADHVVLVEPDGRSHHVPLERVAAVFSRFPPRRS